ncbi:hypothetical protein NCCP2716_13550 [Sporosarcina sp. NCCP-2716]|uniref:HEAT repeat domain-containing protein n=1 Tax=Sporosarcina sp. NCCP-2716 TaxID=2943679 RepID=UPI00203B1488|nr:HEAT repeat domain-containing protein [Sporosarcina sp. NCCP-2716]GKV68857.1 hypothetical protein NCCP2716_13550 [Sporosarcina sp. NCCP-2716]
MTAVPIESIAILIAGLIAALFVFSVYMVIARHRENRRALQASAYLETNRTSWYEYLRKGTTSEETLIPKNEAELAAVEELLRTLVHNVKGDGIEERISGFSNRHLAGFYRRKLRGRNWGKRMNALYRIHDFGVDSLLPECRKMAKRRVSEEESFLLLLIAMKFRPETFLQEHLADLASLSSNNAKELLFTMPDKLFEETIRLADELEPSVRYALIDVIGMKADVTRKDLLERLISSPDSELRIRVLRAFNSLAIVPPPELYEAAARSDVWQERYQAVRMLKWMPHDTVLRFLPYFTEDSMFLVREEARQYSGIPAESIETVQAQSAAAAESKTAPQTEEAERERGDHR